MSRAEPLPSQAFAPTPRLPLHERARAALSEELDAIPWMQLLNPSQKERVQAQLQVVHAGVGERICRIGKPATYWFGVIDGLLKMSNDTHAVRSITFAGLPPGAWFGEGTLLKREAYRYNVQALRRSLVAGLPTDTFHALLEDSLPFNRYVLHQLNERLGQFIAAREIDRTSDPEQRVARNLAALFHPKLYPGVGQLLRITQQELALLVGLSRQRVNEALQSLQQQQMIQIEYGGVRVLALDKLRDYEAAES